jgi:putative membrane-bound dehydrogenase-like protein
VLIGSPIGAPGQGFSPDEAVSHMTLPPGLQARLVASEPLIAQPVAIEFDDRGRLWVIQYLQYPNPAGLQRVKVDRYSRTAYDKFPEPPPLGPKGADRITILEGANRDGARIEHARNFVGGLNLASGLAFGHGGVFVLQTPYLLFYPDRNRDDVPDRSPEVLLSGFGMEDAHSVANSLTWGPDGWLYGCQGSTVTANIRGIEFQQGVWRYHPLTHRFELFCEGGGNSWGLDFDPDGELIYSTNLGEYRMLHGVQGGYYWKSFGKHGALHNPYTFGYFEHVPYQHFTGGHVTVGGIIYQSDALPPEYHGKYISGDLLGHSVQWHTLSRWGSSFKAAYGGELLVPHDTWFASSDATVGPNGSVYVADWFDKRTAHPDPDADWDRSNGRVYEIFEPGRVGGSPTFRKIAARHSVSGTRAGETPALSRWDLRELSNDELIDLLGDSNDWFVRKARRILADRRDARVVPRLQKQIFSANDPRLALQSFWALYVSGGLNDQLAVELLAHTNSAIRKWTVRLLGDECKVSRRVAEDLVRLAQTEPDVRVRAQLACTAKRIPPQRGLPIVERLLARDLDANDPYVPLLLWWAVEHHAVPARDRTLDLLATPKLWKTKLASETVLPRLMRRLAAEATAESMAAAGRLLDSAPDQNGRARLLAALDEGLARSQTVGAYSPLRGLREKLATFWTENTTDRTLIRLLAHLGDTSARQRVITLAANKSTPTGLRIAMLELLGQMADPSTPAVTLAAIAPGELESVQLAGLSALQSFPQADVRPLLRNYTAMDSQLRSKTRDVVLTRKTWAAAFLEGIDSGAFPKNDIPIDQLQKVALLEDDRLNEIIRTHWGNITRGTPEEKLADVRRFNNDLRAFSGDATKGHETFMKTCAVCHRLFGEGNLVGPDLTGANRKDRDYLLVNIVDPSAVIRKEFISYNVQTTDGRVLTGLLAEQSSDSITLLGSNSERTSIPRSQLKSIDESKTSLMPEGLLHTLKPQELRDLFAWLQADPPVAARP